MSSIPRRVRPDAADDGPSQASPELTVRLVRLARSPQGVEEDHRFEQFFYDEATTDRIMRFAARYERPLFLCNPSLAARAEKAGMDYLLLDRDPRWGERLPKHRFRRFELSQPRQARFDYDAVFCDPPFANVALADLRKVVDLLAATPEQAAAPLWLAFVSDREEAVLEAFDGYQLERKPPALGYRSVKEKTQERIFLYGPKFSSSSS